MIVCLWIGYRIDLVGCLQNRFEDRCIIFHTISIDQKKESFILSGIVFIHQSLEQLFFFVVEDIVVDDVDVFIDAQKLMILLHQKQGIGIKGHDEGGVDLVDLPLLFLCLKVAIPVFLDLAGDPAFHLGSCLVCKGQYQKMIDIDLALARQRVDAFR